MRLNGYRVPRRIQRGKAQTPHPVTVKRQEREAYLWWLADRGILDTASNHMKYVYSLDLPILPPIVETFVSMFKWRETPLLGKILP